MTAQERLSSWSASPPVQLWRRPIGPGWSSFAVGGGLLWLVSEAYFKLRGREGMGLGDVKMMLMAGAFLGAKRTLLTIMAGSILGSIIGIVLILARRKEADYELPFGTFLGAGALLVVFFGTPVVDWYQSLLMMR